MTNHTLEGKWKQFKGEVKKQWGKLTDDDIDRIDGSRDKLVGRIQERYGQKRNDVEKDVANFFDRMTK